MAVVRRNKRRAFSLVELVIVVVIIGIVSAIAVPKMSNAAKSAETQHILATIAVVTRAMEHYRAEHGRFPGYDPGSGNPDGTNFVNQLILYSDEDGKTNASLTPSFVYGPYLRPPFPTNLMNELNTVYTKGRATDSRPLGTTGWVSVLATGEFGPNADETVLDDLVEIGKGLGTGLNLGGGLDALK